MLAIANRAASQQRPPLRPPRACGPEDAPPDRAELSAFDKSQSYFAREVGELRALPPPADQTQAHCPCAHTCIYCNPLRGARLPFCDQFRINCWNLLTSFACLCFRKLSKQGKHGRHSRQGRRGSRQGKQGQGRHGRAGKAGQAGEAIRAGGAGRAGIRRGGPRGGSGQGAYWAGVHGASKSVKSASVYVRAKEGTCEGSGDCLWVVWESSAGWQARQI